MSASNWAVCPTCSKKFDETIRSEREALAAQYGELPASDFTRQTKELEERQRREMEAFYRLQTFREDYEIHGAEDGMVTVSYSGKCDMCGTGLTFTHQHEILAVGAIGAVR